MKKILQITALIAFTSLNSFANENVIDQEIKEIQENWAISKYQSKDNNGKIEGYQKCATKSENLLKNYPNSAKLLIWQGICLSSEAELVKLKALGKVKKAKKLFEEAAKIDEKSLDGSAYTNLAVLYHRVPGWPIGFGDSKKSEEYFKKVLKIAPDNIDANYFYALFLADKKDDYKLALKYLEIAKKSPSRNRPLADNARKKEIEEKIIEFKKKI